MWTCTFPAPLPHPAGCVVAVGNFDGVHPGHQHLLQQAQATAAARSLPLVVLTFHPHPRAVVRPDTPFLQLQTLPERIAALHAAGAEGVAVLPFTPERAAQSPAGFMDEILTTWLHAQVVVVGANFHFGHKAQGSVETLRGNTAFQTQVVPLLHDDEGAHSSTRLRQAQQKDDPR